MAEILASRAPHGARGLKLRSDKSLQKKEESRPARGAWIETCVSMRDRAGVPVASRTGRVD